MARQKRSDWVADFETTTKADDCRVWAWGLANVATAEHGWDVEMGNTLSGFIERIQQMPSIIYFHNLKFDGRFILDYLFRELGYVHVQKNPTRGEFSTLIDNMGTFYMLTIHWETGHKTEFRDSLKKLPMGVKAIAPAFGMEIVKGDIDYHTERPIGHELTDGEREYLACDVLIIAKALRMEFEAGMKKLTVGSDSLADFKTTMGGNTMFTRMFPVLSETMDAEIRKAYRGGFTYADPRYTGRITRNGRTYDINSLYPWVMYTCLLPFGAPVWREGFPETTPERPLAVMSITFTAKLKPNHIPCIQVKGSGRFLATEYQTEIAEPVTLSCTNVDLALWEDHYDMDILSYNGGWLFTGIQGVFNDYIDKWMEVKKAHKGGMRVLAKLHLTSLYGKFATNPDVTGKVPVFENDIVKLVTGPPETKEPIYTAMGVFITAYARDKMIRSAQANYDTFAYADTDSLHVLTDADPEGLWVHPLDLGAWKFEYAFDRAMFIRAKTYIEHLSEEDQHSAENCEHDEHTAGCAYETHIAGLPVTISEKLTIDDFTGGRRFDGKLSPRTVPGGVVLENVDYTLPMW